MLVKDLMNKNAVYCEPDESISQALSKMKKYRIHQLPVLENKELKGILTLNKIITREIDPAMTKVSTLMISSPRISPDDSIEEAITLILGSDLRAVPVLDSKLVGMISEQDLLKAVKLEDNLAVSECYYVEEFDDVGKVKDMIIHKNISRVPVVKDGRFIGVIGTLDLIGVLEGNKRFEARSGRMNAYKEEHRINLDKTSVTAVMTEPIIMKEGYNINAVIKLLQDHEEVLVENGILGIITPKNILRLTVKPKRFSYVQITGAEDEDSMTIEKIQQSASELIQRLSKSTELQPMKIHIKKHKTLGPKTKYSMHIELPTAAGVFVSTKTHGLGRSYSDLATIAQKAMHNLEREIRTKLQKSEKTDKKTISLKRMRKSD
jgi:CBS domain-containing protein